MFDESDGLFHGIDSHGGVNGGTNAGAMETSHPHGDGHSEGALSSNVEDDLASEMVLG
jgi:hypothetical protein